MLSPEENELLTRVGPGTPMGALMRRYWLPACLSEELPEPDGAPMRVRLLGEDLVAFRDTQGQVGLLDEACSHRCASLAYGRNEGAGLRCLYHGWKYDVHGNILEMPAEPQPLTGKEVGADAQAEGTPMGAAPRRFKDRIKHPAYPTRELAGTIWTYMGPPDRMPVFPEWEWTRATPESLQTRKIFVDCNWAQALEGSIDSSHSDYLHSNDILFGPGGRPAGDHAPRLEAENTAYGFRYAAIRRPDQDEDRQKYVRVTLFVFPCHVFIPPDRNPGLDVARHQAFVPIDDETHYFYGWNYDRLGPLPPNYSVVPELGPGYRPQANRSNMHLQDRAKMKAGHWSGVRTVRGQDIAMTESMGPNVRREREHLGTSDVAVIRMRRLVLDAVRALQAGHDPPGLDPSIPYGSISSDERVVPVDLPWQAVGAFAGEYPQAAPALA